MVDDIIVHRDATLSTEQRLMTTSMMRCKTTASLNRTTDLFRAKNYLSTNTSAINHSIIKLCYVESTAIYLAQCHLPVYEQLKDPEWRHAKFRHDVQNRHANAGSLESPPPPPVCCCSNRNGSRQGIGELVQRGRAHRWLIRHGLVSVFFVFCWVVRHWLVEHWVVCD